MKATTTLTPTPQTAESINPRTLSRTIAVYAILFAGWLFLKLHFS